MTSKNDITGDKLATKPASDAYRDNWDRIFGKKPVASEEALGVTSTPETRLKDDEETE